MVAYIVSIVPTAKAYTFQAKQSLVKSLPVVIAFSQKGIPETANQATYRVNCAVMIKTSLAIEAGAGSNDARLASEALVAAVFDALHLYTTADGDVQSLADAITAAGRALAVSDAANNADMADFTCESIVDVGVEQGLVEDGACWVDTLNVEMICCPSNVS